jgi:hypothetical protein
MVLSDQLNIRQYSSHDSWAVGPILTQAEEADRIISANTAHVSSLRMSGDVPGLPTAVTPIPGTLPTPAPAAPPGEIIHPLLADLVRPTHSCYWVSDCSPSSV